MVIYSEEICKKRAQIRWQKRIRGSNHSFSKTLKPEAKTAMVRMTSKQMKKRKSSDIEIIDWMLAIDVDPSQIPSLFF